VDDIKRDLRALQGALVGENLLPGATAPRRQLLKTSNPRPLLHKSKNQPQIIGAFALLANAMIFFIRMPWSGLMVWLFCNK